jgi:hypothetical protein
MIIDWRTIPHSEQRYETCGDYWEDGDTVHFRSSKLSDAKYEWLVFLHELVEYFLCRFAGIVLSDIDDFDVAYEKARDDEATCAPCGCKIQAEPGFDKHAPYHWQHFFADNIERLTAWALGVNWIAYEREVDSLSLKA